MAHVTDPAARLEALLRRAFDAARAAGEFPAEGTLPGTVRQCADPRNGELCATHALAAASGLGLSPAETAARLARHFPREQEDFIPPEAVNGYLNFRLTESWYTRTLNAVEHWSPSVSGAGPLQETLFSPEGRDDIGDPVYLIRYVCRRCRTLAELDGNTGPADAKCLSSERERQILRMLAEAPALLERKGTGGRIKEYAVALAAEVPGLYSAGTILDASPEARRAQGALCRGVYAVLTACMDALGLNAEDAQE